MGKMLLRGTFREYRNISHQRLINAYADWILDRSEYPLSFDAVMPTLRLLADIERLVPSYQRASRVEDREGRMTAAERERKR